MENTVIKVTGRGRIKLPPDVAIFSISLNGTSDDYASAIASACNAEGGTVRAEFDPDDVSATDEVTISWSIAGRVRK